ncbi:hypothetical protein Tco_0785489 [Tanacetum coccineum]
MGDENPIRTLEDYSKTSHEGYRNTIELPDPNQHLKGFLKLVDSLDLDGENRERTRMENVYPKHGLVSRTYYKKSLIMASIVGFRSKFFMTMSIPSQDEPLTNRPVVSFVTETPKNPGHLVPTTLSIAWKIPNKPLLNTHPRVSMKWEVSGILSSPSKTILVTPTIHHGEVIQTLGGDNPKILKPTAKKMEEINNFQQEPDESLFCAWKRFKELLIKCPQHYLTDMQEVILFYNGLDVPTQ